MSRSSAVAQQEEEEVDADELSTRARETSRILQVLIQTKHKLQVQLCENTMVLEELEKLGCQNDVYKLVGPILQRQPQDEAKENVRKRIDFIKNEISRTEGRITEENENRRVQREKLEKLKGSLAQAQAQAQA